MSVEKKVILIAGPTASGKSELAIKLAKNKDENSSLREKSRTAAKQFLFNNKKALKEFEIFLTEVFNAEKKGRKLKNESIIKS